MGNLLDFGGRLGRLAFLGWSLALGAFAIGSALALMLLAALSSVLAVLGAIALAGFAFLASVSLQVRRLRDIGWPPLPIVAGWFAFAVADAGVAHLVPSLRMHGGGTLVGALVNLGLALVLLFWPGDGGEDLDEPAAPLPRRVAEAAGAYVPTTRQRRLPGEPPPAPRPAGPQGFGRRTV